MMWREAITVRLRYCFRTRLKVLTNPTKRWVFRDSNLQPLDTIPAPDCSMKIHHTLPIPNPISAVFITVAIPDHDYRCWPMLHKLGPVTRGAGHQYGRNFITNLPSDHSHIQRHYKAQHSTNLRHIWARLRTAMTADDPLRPLKTAVGSVVPSAVTSGETSSERVYGRHNQPSLPQTVHTRVSVTKMQRFSVR
jgi:hypothetical protein